MNACCIYLCFCIFENVCDQLQMESSLVPCKKRSGVCPKANVTACETVSLNFFPDELILEIMSHFEAEELSLTLAQVCKRWNNLARNVTLWKTLHYEFSLYPDICRVKEVRYTALLGLRLISLRILPTQFFIIHNLKEYFRNCVSFHPEVKQVARGLHSLTPSFCCR